jgi:hypothetical protein
MDRKSSSERIADGAFLIYRVKVKAMEARIEKPLMVGVAKDYRKLPQRLSARTTGFYRPGDTR